MSAYSSLSRPLPVPAIDDRELPSGWQSDMDETGQPYYRNDRLAATSRAPPPSLPGGSKRGARSNIPSRSATTSLARREAARSDAERRSSRRKQLEEWRAREAHLRKLRRSGPKVDDGDDDAAKVNLERRVVHEKPPGDASRNDDAAALIQARFRRNQNLVPSKAAPGRGRKLVPTSRDDILSEGFLAEARAWLQLQPDSESIRRGHEAAQDFAACLEQEMSRALEELPPLDSFRSVYDEAAVERAR